MVHIAHGVTAQYGDALATCTATMPQITIQTLPVGKNLTTYRKITVK